MPAVYRRIGESRVAFILDERLIRDTVRIIEENATQSVSEDGAGGKILYEVKFAGGGSLSTDDLTEVLLLPNSAS